MKALWGRVINALSLIVFVLMISTGSLLKWVLPPGSGWIEIAGHGRQGRVVYTVLGLDRHDWGSMHFYISLILIFLLCIHLVLHWQWIKVTAWGTSAKPQPLGRKMIIIAIILFILIALAFPWLALKEVHS